MTDEDSGPLAAVARILRGLDAQDKAGHPANPGVQVPASRLRHHPGLPEGTGPEAIRAAPGPGKAAAAGPGAQDSLEAAGPLAAPLTSWPASGSTAAPPTGSAPARAQTTRSRPRWQG